MKTRCRSRCSASKAASGDRHRAHPRDDRGSVHIFETMIVTLLLAGAVVAVSALELNTGRDDDDGQEGSQRAEDLLGATMVQPALSEDAQYTHRLEELILQHLAGDNRVLDRLAQANGVGTHRLLLQMDGKTMHVAGAPDAATTGTAPGGRVAWHSIAGTTIVLPTMSVHNATMPVYFELLPLAMHEVPAPPGDPYTARVSLLRTDGSLLEREVRLAARPPLADESPLRVDPVDESGNVDHEQTEAEVDTGSGYEWTLRFRLTPAPPVERTWLDARTTLRVERPVGWDGPTLDEGNWTRTNPADEPVWDLRYIGRPHRGHGTAWLNLTFHRDATDPLRHHEQVTLRQEGAGSSTAAVVLSPTTASAHGPWTVHASQPGPLAVDSALPMRFTVTNPSDESVAVENLTVRFPDRSHQYRHEPSDWTRIVEDGAALYHYEGPAVTIPAYRAKTLELPMKVEKAEGDNRLPLLPPILRSLDSGPDPPLAALATPHAASGTALASLPGHAFPPGDHAVGVTRADGSPIPPGRGSFRLVDVASSDLAALQAARHTMTLTLDKTTLGRSEAFTVRLDTGDLGAVLDPAATIDVAIETRDLWSYLAGRPGPVNQTSGPIPESIAFVVPHDPDAFPGPVVVTARVTVAVAGVGDVDLQFVTHAFRSATGEAFNPSFLNAHLHYWTRGPV